MSTNDPAQTTEPDVRPGDSSPAGRRPALDQPFDVTGLVSLRSAVAAHATALGLSRDRCDDLVLLAHELASNVVAHGGGQGRLRLWADGGRVHCQVTDSGPGLPAGLDTDGQQPPLGATGGRGLWLVRTLADDLDLRSGAGGTTITATINPVGAGGAGEISGAGKGGAAGEISGAGKGGAAGEISGAGESGAAGEGSA